MPWQELVAMDTIWATGTTVRESLGPVGLTFLGVAVTMAILTGINGFFVASSRLLFGMGRARVLPAWFSSVHETHRTPHKAILFTAAVSLVAPWLGREVILWIVDMSAVGTSVGYLYTCVAAFVVARGMRGRAGALSQKIFSAAGAAMAIGFLVLLLVPGMPAFMARPSWIALAAWVALGTVFFLVKARSYKAIPEAELRYLIVGSDAEST
jgi:amino acid transporter